MRPINPKPSGAPQKMNTYGGDGNHALCEQLRHMQKDMNSTQRSVTELLEMNRQILESMQHQHRATAALLDRVEKASTDADDGVASMRIAAESMKQNTDMIVRASLIAAFSLADDDKFNAASERAKQEMTLWKAEQSGLKLASKNA